MSEDNGTATVNGEQKAEETPQAQAENKQGQGKQGEKAPDRPTPHNVPYSRFQEVVEQRQGLESTLSELLDGMIGELPEDMRDLVPNLPPTEKAAWIRAARERGLFAGSLPSQGRKQTSSPDAKRPGGKQQVDLSGMNATEKLRFGFSQRK